MSSSPVAVPAKAIHFAIADMIRAGAILLVVVAHLTGSAQVAFHGRSYSFDYLGTWGVNAFFVLSGFLLTKPFLKSLLDPSVPLPATKQFLFRRFLRIYPLYAAAIFFSCAVILLERAPLPQLVDLIKHFLFLQDFSLDTINSFDGPLWTMPIDATFYLLLPALAFGLNRVMRGWSRAARLNAVIATICAVILCSLAYRYAQARYNSIAVRSVLDELMYVRNIVGFGASFAAGTALALYGIVTGDRPKPKRPIYLGILACSAFFAWCTTRIDYIDHRLPIGIAALHACFADLAATIAVAFLLYALADGHFRSITRFAQSHLVASLSALSYAIYLVHLPIIVAVKVMLHIPHGNAGFLMLTAVSLPLIFLAACVAHNFVEKLFLALKEKHREPLSERPIDVVKHAKGWPASSTATATIESVSSDAKPVTTGSFGAEKT